MEPPRAQFLNQEGGSAAPRFAGESAERSRKWIKDHDKIVAKIVVEVPLQNSSAIQRVSRKDLSGLA